MRRMCGKSDDEFWRRVSRGARRRVWAPPRGLPGTQGFARDKMMQCGEHPLRYLHFDAQVFSQYMDEVELNNYVGN